MSKPKRRWTIGLMLALVFLATAEVSLRHWKRPKACIEIINEGKQPIEGLVVGYGGARVPVGRVGAGRSVRVWMTAGPLGPLRLDFEQEGNPLKGFVVPDFEPRECVANGLKQVIVIRPNRVQRFVDADESGAPSEGLLERFRNWALDEYHLRPSP